MSINLKEIRESCGYKQEKMAHLLGANRSTYAHWETGRREIPHRIEQQIRQLFDLEAVQHIQYYRRILTEKVDDMVTEQVYVGNKVSCRWCGDILMSHSPDVIIGCTCGTVAISGGDDELIRFCDMHDFAELSYEEAV